MNKWKPMFHIVSDGWLNDPNGCCVFNGEYHVFYQYSEQPDCSGVIQWGHVCSQDLLHWKALPVAIMPDSPEDKDGAYSGSALVEGDTLQLFYTGNVFEEGQADDEHRLAYTMTVSSKDGIQFVNKKVLMTNSDYPREISRGIRDPKVWKEDAIWVSSLYRTDRNMVLDMTIPEIEKPLYYMVQGASSKKHVGEAVIFRSVDKIHWKAVRILYSEEPLGYMWECPDVFRMEDYYFLSCCLQGVEPMGLHYQNPHQSGYFQVDMKKKKEARIPVNMFREWDHGFDFYAPQTWRDEDGTRLLIGWMGMPDSPYRRPEQEEGWSNMLTIPRVLHLSERKGIFTIAQKPVPELALLRGKCYENQPVLLKSMDVLVDNPCGESFLLELTDFTDESFHVDAHVKVQEAESGEDLLFEMSEFFEESSLVLQFNKEESTFLFAFDSERLGAGRGTRGIRISEIRKLEIITDASSVEVFINEGEEVFTSRIYPMYGKLALKVTEGDVRTKTWELK